MLMILEIINDLDEDGTPLTRVPLTNTDQTAVLFQQDFNFLIKKGLNPRWRLSNNQVLESGRGRVPISRLIVDAKVGEKVYIKDRNPCNLKRNNLVVTSGNGRTNTREKLLPKNEKRSHSLLRNIRLKTIEKPVPWQAELVS
jgi:hypothetical protein